jgi:hypothetical protein
MCVERERKGKGREKGEERWERDGSVRSDSVVCTRHKYTIVEKVPLRRHLKKSGKETHADFELLDVLGKGSFGSVYKVRCVSHCAPRALSSHGSSKIRIFPLAPCAFPALLCVGCWLVCRRCTIRPITSLRSSAFRKWAATRTTPSSTRWP